MPRRLSLVEVMIELSPTLWRRWRALARALHREIPSIAAANADTPVARQLLERVDRVAYVVNASKIARRMVEFYRAMVDELFRAGAGGEISAVYFDHHLRRDQSVSRAHWTGQAPLEADPLIFAWDTGSGWDKAKWLAPGAPPFDTEPVEDRDPLQPDQRLRLKDNSLKPWPGLTLPAVRVILNDDVPKMPRRRPRKAP